MIPERFSDREYPGTRVGPAFCYGTFRRPHPGKPWACIDGDSGPHGKLCCTCGVTAPLRGAQ